MINVSYLFFRMTERRKFHSKIVPLGDLDVSMLASPQDFSNDDLEDVSVLYADDLIMVKLSEYIDVRVQHVMATAALKVTREENSELTRLIRDEFAADKATNVSIRAMAVMEEGLSKALKMAKDYRQSVAAAKKNSRPRIQKLDRIIQELEDVTPVDDIETFLEHLLIEDQQAEDVREGNI